MDLRRVGIARPPQGIGRKIRLRRLAEQLIHITACVELGLAAKALFDFVQEVERALGRHAIGATVLEIERDQGVFRRIGGLEESVGLRLRVCIGAEMVGAPQQSCGFGLSAALGIGGVGDGRAFARLVDHALQAACPRLDEVGAGRSPTIVRQVGDDGFGWHGDLLRIPSILP